MSTTVAEVVRAHLATLPRAELKVARALLAGYPAVGLKTVASLADEAGVSAPTVLRLTERLGYGGYPQFQDALRDELHQRALTPLDRYPDDPAADDPLTRARAVFQRNIADTFDGVDPVAFRRAVELLSSPRNRVHATGGRFTAVLAKNLVQQLEVLRPGTHFLAAEDRTSNLTDLGRRDVLFAVDVRRYQESTITFGREAAARGAQLIVLTDRWLSPLAEVGEAVLTCSLDAPHPLDSMVPALAVIEALLAGVVDALGSSPRERMRRYDAAWETAGFGKDYSDRLDTHPNHTKPPVRPGRTSKTTKGAR